MNANGIAVNVRKRPKRARREMSPDAIARMERARSSKKPRPETSE